MNLLKWNLVVGVREASVWDRYWGTVIGLCVGYKMSGKAML